MPIIDLNKVTELYVNDIRDSLNFHEKLELSRLLLSGIEHDHEKSIKRMRL